VFYAGDAFESLNLHRHLTGVDKAALIPLEPPALVGSACADAFEKWSRCVVREAKLTCTSTFAWAPPLSERQSGRIALPFPTNSAAQYPPCPGAPWRSPPN
jgi:hypothetical protein